MNFKIGDIVKIKLVGKYYLIINIDNYNDYDNDNRLLYKCFNLQTKKEEWVYDHWIELVE